MSDSSSLVIYQSSNGAIELPVDATSETIWASQKQIAEVFDVNVPAISKHISNILDEGELSDSTVSKMEIVQKEGDREIRRTLEEKAAHLLYFTVKNHVFVDGNKRSGAYAFVWFLQKVRLLNTHEISPQALTAITLLVAESDPKDKDKMIGLVLLLLGVENRK